jgi:TPR repeat protein
MWRQAADQGHANAQFNVGVAHERGEGGLQPSPSEAVRLYRLAAAQGHTQATARLQEMERQFRVVQ